MQLMQVMGVANYKKRLSGVFNESYISPRESTLCGMTIRKRIIYLEWGNDKKYFIKNQLASL